MSAKNVNTETVTTSVTDLEKFLAAAMLVPMGDPNDPNCIWGAPVLIWGPPGIGKSSRVAAASALADLTAVPLIPATKQPEDFGGAPMPPFAQMMQLTLKTAIAVFDSLKSMSSEPLRKLQGDFDRLASNTVIESTLPEIHQLVKQGSGVLFLDEIGWATTAVQSALLNLVLNRRVGAIDLPPEVRVLAAANPSDDAEGGYEMTPPMANRFLHIHEKVSSVQQWNNYMMGRKPKMPSMAAAQDYIVDNWHTEWPRVNSLIQGFMLASGQKMLHDLPPEGNPSRNLAWASPRSWEMAAKCLTTAQLVEKIWVDPEDDFKSMLGATTQHKAKKHQAGLTTLGHELVSACVGPSKALPFVKYALDMDLPDPRDVLIKGWQPDTKRLDRSLAVLGSVTGFVLAHPPGDERMRFGLEAWKLLHKCFNASLGDIAVPYMKDLHSAGFMLGKNAQMDATLMPIILELGKTPYAEFLD